MAEAAVAGEDSNDEGHFVAIDIKSPAEIGLMRESCRLAAATLKMIAGHVVAGVSTGELDRLCHEFILDHGAIPAPLNYKGFPNSICTSVNEVVCHGIPRDDEILKDGDLINVDVTTILRGFHGDTSATFCVGEVGERARHVIDTARRCLELGIEVVRPGGRIRDIGGAIEDYAHGQSCSVVRDYCGHGIGRQFHAEPQVPHYRARGPNPRLRPGMTFTIEPMINLGTWQTRTMKDGWTVKTRDERLSAQFEHTVLVTADGVEVLTDQALVED